MLFQRLYNWIKYKTLPPSFLFKNRLFIERDSKHKRIFNNFGLVFRNSKWTNHETYNVKTQFRFSFYKYILLFIFVVLTIVFIFNFNKYYLCLYLFNAISLTFWISIDTLDYYFSFLIWIATVSSSLFFNLLYSYFFFNNFSENSTIKKIFSHNFFLNNLITSRVTQEKSLSNKHDSNWVFYLWLNNNSQNNYFFLENIFSTSLHKNTWKNYYDFFIKLYALTRLCALSSANTSLSSKNLTIDVLTNNFFKGDKLLNIKQYLQSSLDGHSNIFLYYILKNYTNYFATHIERFQEENLFFNKKRTDLFSIHTENELGGFLINFKIGTFFFKNFSFEKFSFLHSSYFEFFNLNSNLRNHINSAKWNRWLYRYSILHRKMLKNSHKITLIKKLLNSGFYNNSLFEKNIWASENILKYDSNNYFLNSLFRQLYPSLMGYVSSWNASDQLFKNNSYFLEFLNKHEESFFWFNKRFYLFNTISSNFIKNERKVHSAINSKISFFENMNDYQLYISFLQKSPLMKKINFSQRITNNLAYVEIFSSPVSKTTYLLKDLQLIFDENNFLIKNNLDTLNYICCRIFLNNNTPFYSLLSHSSAKVDFSSNFYEQNKKINITTFAALSSSMDGFDDLAAYGLFL